MEGQLAYSGREDRILDSSSSICIIQRPAEVGVRETCNSKKSKNSKVQEKTGIEEPEKFLSRILPSFMLAREGKLLILLVSTEQIKPPYVVAVIVVMLMIENAL